MLYNTIDIPTADDILTHYGVDYIYVGGLERAYYAAEGLAKFDAMTADGLLNLIYDQNGVKIYAVNEQSRASIAVGAQ